MAEITKPQPLQKEDNRKDFDCGQPVLNHWFLRHAWKNEVSNASRTYVIKEKMTEKVIGFVSLATGQIEREYLVKSQQRNQPNPIPVLILGQLAIGLKYQGQGLGVDLLKYALEITVSASKKIGIVGVITHPINQEAKCFYTKWGFQDLLADPDGSMLIRTKDLLASGF